MGHGFHGRFHIDARTWIWVVGMIFAVIIIFQYLELPYDGVVSTILPSSNVPVAGNASLLVGGGSTSEVGNVSTSLKHQADGAARNVGTSEEKGTHLDVDSVSEINVQLNRSSGTDKNSLPVNNSYAERSVDPNHVVNESESEIGTETGGSSSRAKVAFGTNGKTFHGNGTSEELEKNLDVNPESGGNSGFSGQSMGNGSPLIASPPVTSMITDALEHAEKDRTTSYASTSEIFQVRNSTTTSSAKNDHPAEPEETVNIGADSLATEPELNQSPEMTSSVATISEMNTWLLQSRSRSFSREPKWSSAPDTELVNIRRQIENALVLKNDPELYGSLYHNVSMFKRSYDLMEETLKVYIYKEGKKPVFHHPYLRGIYASEGWFMKLLESNKRFVTKDPREAHLFYLPFSSRMLEEKLYVAGSHSDRNLVQYLKEYIDLISAKHPFWNRTAGSDHFLVACHDWGPAETRQYMANCLRALCNADVREGYVFGKDVSLPETHVRSQQKPLKMVGGRPPSQRKFLAFFAGRMHGYLRPMLVEQWGNGKDPNMKIFSIIPKVKGVNSYVEYMKSSKYCLCPRGYEVNSPRVVEAIFFDCVPVIISDNYVPPFLEVLNWESFALFVLEKDVPNLKNILLSVPESRYVEMQMMVKKVQKHFLWHTRPEKYDIFHMILHSIWYNRVFRTKTT